MDVQLTKDGEYLICALYNEYLEKREAGQSKETAKHVGSSKGVHQRIMSEWSFPDVNETCRELSRANMLNCLFGDDVVDDSYLTDSAIVYLENRFKGKASSVLEVMAKIKAAIPFL